MSNSRAKGLILLPEQYLVGKNHEDPHYAIFPSLLLLCPSTATASRFRPRWKHVLASPGRADWLKIYTLNQTDWLSVAEWLGLGLKGSFVQWTNTEATEKYKYINNTVRSWAPFWTVGHRKFVPSSRLVRHCLFLRFKYPTQHPGIKYPQPMFIRYCERQIFAPKQAEIQLIYLNP